MTPVRQSLRGLTLADRRLVETWLDEFEAGWHTRRLAEQAARLPPPGNPLRGVALAEMVKVDLERQWRAGQRPSLESYLARFPELGTVDTVDASLVQAECDVLQAAGVPIDSHALARRFPRQAALLRRAGAAGTGSQAGQPSSAMIPQRSVPPVKRHAVDTRSSAGSTHGPAGQPLSVGDPPEEFGRYRIRSKLGKGGMGAVYLAHDTELDRQVALKVPFVAPDDAREWLERFYREARAAAALQHPNICPVHDVGEIAGTHYLTMAYIEGRTLADVIARAAGKPLDEKVIVPIVRKIALALGEAHRRGTLHRDLKPANIMIDRRREPIVMDFGLARRGNGDESRLTMTGAILGTPGYMSPEQVLGNTDAIGPACDIYSLGVVLYELLCGKLPFEGPTAAVLGQILAFEPPAPSRHRPGIDPALEAICLKAMAKQPQARYATMGDFAAALADWAEKAAKNAASAANQSPRGATVIAQSPPVAVAPLPAIPIAVPVPISQPAPFSDLAVSVAARGRDSRNRRGRGAMSRPRIALIAAAAALVLLGVVIVVRTRGTVVTVDIGTTDGGGELEKKKRSGTSGKREPKSVPDPSSTIGDESDAGSEVAASDVDKESGDEPTKDEPSEDEPEAQANAWVPLFNGKETDLTNWERPPENKGTWDVKDGVLIGRGGERLGPAQIATKRKNFTDYQLRMEIGVPRLPTAAVYLRAHTADGTNKGYRVSLLVDQGAAPGPVFAGSIKSVAVRLGSVVVYDVLAAPARIPDGSYVVEIHVSVNTITSYIDAKEVAQYTDAENAFPSGEIRLVCRSDAEISFRRIEIKESRGAGRRAGNPRRGSEQE